MTSNPSPYEAVIADLKRQRVKIDQAIKALEELTGGAGAMEAALPANTGGFSPAEGAFLEKPIPIFQDIARSYPSGSDDVCPFSAVVAAGRGPAP